MGTEIPILIIETDVNVADTVKLLKKQNIDYEVISGKEAYKTGRDLVDNKIYPKYDDTLYHIPTLTKEQELNVLETLKKSGGARHGAEVADEFIKFSGKQIGISKKVIIYPLPAKKLSKQLETALLEGVVKKYKPVMMIEAQEYKNEKERHTREVAQKTGTPLFYSSGNTKRALPNTTKRGSIAVSNLVGSFFPKGTKGSITFDETKHTDRRGTSFGTPIVAGLYMDEVLKGLAENSVSNSLDPRKIRQCLGLVLNETFNQFIQDTDKHKPEKLDAVAEIAQRAKIATEKWCKFNANLDTGDYGIKQYIR